jgi:hypothetical protein
MKFRRMPVVWCVLFVLMPFATVEACGPDFSPDVFVRADRPGDMHAFAEGRLGILQTGYDSNDFAVAYRYLNGGKLSPQEEQAYAPPPQPLHDWTRLTPEQLRAAQAAQQKAGDESVPEYPWRQALAAFVPENRPTAENRQAPQPWTGTLLYYNPDYPNCPRPAFQMAALTLASRAQTWGRQSPWLTDWVNAQQTVFSNCSMKNHTMPAPAPAGSPALLQADRAYQVAAAEFYTGNYDQARQSFQAIASDYASPWHAWGGFLAARAEVRAAFAAGPKTDPWSGKVAGFDKPDMLRAQQMLQALLAHHDPGLPRSAIVQELNFVRLRTEPDQRFSEICAALAGPAPDGNFAQDLKDLSYVLEKDVAIHSSPPLFAWMMALRGPRPDDALLAWKQQPSLPLLIAALMRTPPTDPSAPELLKAAAAIGHDSPAWLTAMFHRIRLLTGMGRMDEARVLLDGFLPAMRRRHADSALNAFLAERMAVAHTLDEFLEFAPRTVLETNSEGWWYQRETCPSTRGQYSWMKEPCLPSQPMEFDADAAAVLNRAPIEMLIEAARSPMLPANMREELSAAAWTRSVVLSDGESAAKLAPLLPRVLHATANDGAGFPAVLTILQNPGLRPYVEAGISHLNRPGALDEFRDNWWCDDWSGQFIRSGKPAPPVPAPSFFSAQQAKAGAAQYERVLALSCAPQFLGHRVLDYAKSHPFDPRLPEALALTVRATHYACLSWRRDDQQAARENTSVSKAAFDLLHQRFPHSPWTARTKFYY